jgi:hypothetical protein
MKNEKRHMGDIGHMPLGGQESYQEMFYSNNNTIGHMSGHPPSPNGGADGPRSSVHTVFERAAGKGKHSKGKITSFNKPKNRKKKKR